MKHYHFSDSEAKTLLKSMIVLVDTREQQNSWVKTGFVFSTIFSTMRIKSD
jgi:hypothetical protein